MRQLPATVRVQLDLQLLFASASTALVENGLYLETEDRVRALDIILRTYLDRLKEIERANPDLKSKPAGFVGIVSQSLTVQKLKRKSTSS